MNLNSNSKLVALFFPSKDFLTRFKFLPRKVFNETALQKTHLILDPMMHDVLLCLLLER
jgi:hypothetical protein